MPDDFDAIERRFGGKGTATAPPSDFAAIEERFGKPASSDAVTAYANAPTTGGPKPWELDKPDTSTSFGESFAQGAMSAARDLPFKVVEAGMRLAGQDVDLTHAGKIADMTLGGPSVGEAMAEERRLREGNPAGYGLGGTALDTAAMVATGGAATSGLRAAVPWLARAAESASPLIRAAGTTAEAGAVGAGMGAAMNPKDMTGGAESGALFMALAGNASRLIAGANPGAVRAVLAESGAMPLAGVGTRLATEGRVGDWREFLTDVGVGLVFGAAKAPEAGRARVRALVEESIKNNQTFDEFKASFGAKSIEEIKASVGRAEVPPPVSSLPGVEPAILEVPEGPRLKTGPTGPEVLAEAEANRVGLKSGVPSKPLEGPPKDRIAWAPSEPVDTSPIAPEPASAGGKPSIAVSREAEAMAAEKEGQRGYVALGRTGGSPEAEAATEASPSLFDRVWGAMKDKAVGVRDWVRGRGLDKSFRADPESARPMAEGSTMPTLAKSQANLSDMTVKEGFSKTDALRFDLLSAEHERRSVGKTFRGDKLFDRLFPTEESVQAAFASPEMQEMARRTKAEFQTHVEPLNIRGGGVDPAQAGKGRAWQEGMGDGEFRDLRTNMVPMTEADAQAGGTGSRGVTAKSIRGPQVSQSPVGRAFTGDADAYDVSLRSRFERGMSRSGLTAKRLDAIESMLRTGTLRALGEGERPEKGWVAFKPDVSGDIDIQGNVGADLTPRSVRGKTLYLTHPEMAPEMRSFFGLDFVSRNGALALASRATTSAATMGLAEAGGHTLTTLLPVAVRAGQYGGIKTPIDATRFLFDTKAAETERVRQATYGGSRPVFEKGPVSKWLGPATKPLEAFDLAVRKSLLDAAEADIKAGRLPDTFETRRNALLEANNYNALAMDAATKVFRTLTGNFIVAGKGAVSTAFRFGKQLFGSPGEEMSPSLRLMRAGRAAAIVGGYLMYVGVKNKKMTGEAYPKGIPFGSEAEGRDPKTGAWTYSWDVARPLGVAQLLSLTGAGDAIDDTREGRSLLTTAIDTAGAPLRRLERAALEGPLMSAGETLFDKRKSGPDRAKDAAMRALPIAHFLYALFHTPKPGEDEEHPGDVLVGVQEDRSGKTPAEIARKKGK